MSTPGDELDQFYRQSYRRLMIASVVFCVVTLCAIAAGQTAIGSTVLRQMIPGYNYINPRPIMKEPIIRSAPNCRFKKSWSIAGLLPVSTASIGAKVYLKDDRRRGYVTLTDLGDVLKLPLLVFILPVLGG